MFVECSRLSNIICGIAKKTLIVRLLIKVDYTLGTGLLFSVFFMGNRFYDSTQRMPRDEDVLFTLSLCISCPAKILNSMQQKTQ